MGEGDLKTAGVHRSICNGWVEHCRGFSRRRLRMQMPNIANSGALHSNLTVRHVLTHPVLKCAPHYDNFQGLDKIVGFLGRVNELIRRLINYGAA